MDDIVELITKAEAAIGAQGDALQGELWEHAKNLNWHILARRRMITAREEGYQGLTDLTREKRNMIAKARMAKKPAPDTQDVEMALAEHQAGVTQAAVNLETIETAIRTAAEGVLALAEAKPD